MKLWVDDHRPPPPGWRRAKTVAEAKVYLEQGIVTHASLDHDLGACRSCAATGRHIGNMSSDRTTFYDYCPHVPSGYDLCLWMEETGRWPSGGVTVHSANPLGARRMLEVIERSRHSLRAFSSEPKRPAVSQPGSGSLAGIRRVLSQAVGVLFAPWRQRT